MSKQDLHTSPDYFLNTKLSGLSIDPQDECPICKVAYGDCMQDETVITKCNHLFHQRCLQTWLESQTEWTCPMCRTKFFQIPEAHDYEEPWGWEGLQDAYDTMTLLRLHQRIKDMVDSLWSPSAGDWEGIMVAILTLNIDPPTTALGYTFVCEAIKCFRDSVEAEDQVAEQFDEMLEILDEYEKKQNECTINQAYEAAGINHVVSRVRS